MGKFKRELVPGTYLTTADMLAVLSQQQLRAAALDGQVVLALQAPLAYILDRCCVGRAAAAAVSPALQQQEADSGGVLGGVWASVVAAAAVAGVNIASEEQCEQFRQYQQQLATQRRGNRRAVASGAGSPEQLCLVYLTHQEAVFLSSVLGSCQVYAGVAGGGGGEQQQQQQQAGVPHLSTAAEAGVQLPPSHQHHQQQQQQDDDGGSGLDPQQLATQHQQQQEQLMLPPPPLPSSPAGVQLSGRQLWQWCCSHTTGGARVFAPQYAAYHHMRCLGWLPLPGISYGADYVIYQLHPELCHSDFVVTVMVEGSGREAAGRQAQQLSTMAQPAAASQGQPTSGAAPAAAASSAGIHQQQQQGVGDNSSDAAVGTTQLAWLDACIMHRLARQVLKEMMLLYVVVPPGLSLLEFECIHSMQVREVMVQRWVPGGSREQK